MVVGLGVVSKTIGFNVGVVGFKVVVVVAVVVDGVVVERVVVVDGKVVVTNLVVVVGSTGSCINGLNPNNSGYKAR